jgi:3-oxoacyl-[acyl-carrier protein] reductase
VSDRRVTGGPAIVTGGAHGIGRAICVALASRGADVWTCDVEREGLADTAAAVEAATGRRCRAEIVDVTVPAQVEAFVAEVVAAGEPPSALVNNAGGVAGQTMRPVDEVPLDDWRRIFAINLDAAFHFCRAAVPHMRDARRGSIVNISSGAGRSYSLTGIQAYASAKAGVIGLTRQLARELGPSGVRVNCVAPGFVLSNPATERQWQAMGDEGQRRLLDTIAMHRLGAAEEIAAVVAFLASDESSYVTGQTIGADGGTWMLG